VRHIVLNLSAFPLQFSLETKLACDATPRRETHRRARSYLPLSNFTAFKLFFDNAHSFPALNRFVFEAVGVACDDVIAKNSDCGVLVLEFSI
jgi:hypothetical protein